MIKIGFISFGRLFEIVHRLEHFLRDLVSRFGPDGDYLVIALAVGDHAVAVLLLDGNHVPFGFGDDFLLGRRRYQIVDADRNAGLGGVQKTKVLEIVEHLHSHLVAETNV
jgi:hypothetical protein